MKSKILALSLVIMAASSLAQAAETVRFTIETKAVRIAKGLGAAWNDKNNPVRVHVGDTLEVTNNDTVEHIIHTGGTPFPHGDIERPIRTGESVRYLIEKPHNPAVRGPLYDHETGMSGGQLFWIVAE